MNTALTIADPRQTSRIAALSAQPADVIEVTQPVGHEREAAGLAARCPDCSPLAETVREELTRMPGGAARLIAVDGDGDVVRLRGLAGDYATRHAAIEAAFRAGARGVANEIEVQREQHAIRLARQILVELRNSEHVFDKRVRVCVRDGEVTLSGSVPYAYQRDAAESISRRLAGVRHVVNEIVVPAHPAVHRRR